METTIHATLSGGEPPLRTGEKPAVFWTPNSEGKRPRTGDVQMKLSTTSKVFGCFLVVAGIALGTTLQSPLLLIVFVLVGLVIVSVNSEEFRLGQEEAAKLLREQKDLKAEQDAQIVCPQCHTKGKVSTQRTEKRKGISGGKAVAAVVTGGLSLPFAGISRKDEVTQATCSNCGTTWEF